MRAPPDREPYSKQGHWVLVIPAGASGTEESASDRALSGRGQTRPGWRVGREAGQESWRHGPAAVLRLSLTGMARQAAGVPGQFLPNFSLVRPRRARGWERILWPSVPCPPCQHQSTGCCLALGGDQQPTYSGASKQLS